MLYLNAYTNKLASPSKSSKQKTTFETYRHLIRGTKKKYLLKAIDNLNIFSYQVE